MGAYSKVSSYLALWYHGGATHNSRPGHALRGGPNNLKTTTMADLNGINSMAFRAGVYMAGGVTHGLVIVS